MRLYKALILSILLYNAEVWTIKAQDTKALEGAHFSMMRSMMNLDADTHMSRGEMMLALHLHDLSDYIRQKRMRWIGHALRRKDGDRSKIAVLETLADQASPWTKMVMQDCQKLNLNLEEIPKLAADRISYRHVTHVCTGLPCA